MSVNSSAVFAMPMSEMYAVFLQGSGVGVAGFATRPVMEVSGGGARAYLDDPTRWGAWAHQGHRLWASMAEEFWLHVYKVQRCPQPCSHDWTACPYAHKGERARRRDPRRFSYVGVSCPDYRAHLAAGGGQPASCARGLKCRYAHGVFELWLHPSRFRTRMCESGQLCPRPICFFAHSPAELRHAAAAVVTTSTTPPPHVLLQRAPPPPPHAAMSPPPPARDDTHKLFDLMTPSPGLHATEYCRSPFRAYYDDHATGGASSSSAANVVSTKCSRCAEEEESMVHDYPHVDLIMDLVS